MIIIIQEKKHAQLENFFFVILFNEIHLRLLDVVVDVDVEIMISNVDVDADDVCYSFP